MNPQGRLLGALMMMFKLVIFLLYSAALSNMSTLDYMKGIKSGKNENKKPKQFLDSEH